MTLDERIQRYLDVCDVAVSGQGGHNTFFRVAVAVVQGFDLAEGDARRWLGYYSEKCQPPWTEVEIAHKVGEAMKATTDKPRGWLLGEAPAGVNARPVASPPARPVRIGEGRRPGKVRYDRKLLEAFVERCAVSAEDVSMYGFGVRSVVDPAAVSARDFLDAIYGPEEEVVIYTRYRSLGDFVRKGPQIFRCDKDGDRAVTGLPEGSPDGVTFLAQPVDGLWYAMPGQRNRDGSVRMSRSCNQAITSWRYLVVESDDASAGLWLRAMMALPLAIEALYSSGGKSVHALVRVEADSKEEFEWHRDKAMRSLAILGADPAAITGRRLTRLPGCRRGDRLQRLIYLNPGAEPVPIKALPERHVEQWHARLRWVQAALDGGAPLLPEWERWLEHYRKSPGVGYLWKQFCEREREGVAVG